MAGTSSWRTTREAELYEAQRGKIEPEVFQAALDRIRQPLLGGQLRLQQEALAHFITKVEPNKEGGWLYYTFPPKGVPDQVPLGRLELPRTAPEAAALSN